MFWGAILHSQKKYSQKVVQDFRVSHAVLDSTDGQKGTVQVSVKKNGVSYILCQLEHGKVNQCLLDLNFSAGEEIAFILRGEGSVHLTGYLMPDDLDDDFDLSDEDDNDLSEQVALASKKKGKQKAIANGGSDSDEVDDEDENVDMSALLNADMDDDDDDDDEFDGEEDDSEDEDDDEDDEDDEDEDDSDEMIEEQPKAKMQKLDKAAKNAKKELNGGAASNQQNKKDKKEQKNQEGKQQQQQQQQQRPEKSKEPSKRVLKGGVTIEDIKVGGGPEAKPGKKVQVYYEGRLKSNNKIFDSSKTGSGFRFNLGKSEVIQGWDIGVNGMKLGGKRRIVIPPQMAYGPKGSPPVIPPNATLIFEVELKKVF